MPHASVWPPPELVSKAVRCPLREVDVQPLGGGDNFASAALKVTATTEAGDTHYLIVKRLPLDSVDHVYPVRPAFEVEGRMYSEIMPRIMELLRSVGRDSPPLGPRMLLRVPEPEPSLFFEDISVDGFRLADRQAGLDEAHTRLVLRSLARWHAAGSVLLHAEPDRFLDLPRIVCEEHAAFLDGHLVKGFARFLTHAQEWTDELSQRVVAKLKLLQPSCRERVLDAHRPAALGKAFNVALHGDLWCGNMMFKYDKEGKPEAVRLIDYQIGTWGAPAGDICYFIASVGGEARQRKGALVAEYHEELAACLQALGAKHVPSLADIVADLRRRAMAEVMHVTCGSPIVLAPHSLGFTFENIIDVHNGEGPHPRDEALRRAPAQALIKQYFAAWEKEGLLDELLQQKQYH